MSEKYLSETDMAHVSENTHWYDRAGNPVYEVPSADGKSMVTPDIRHARKLNLLPGFSAVERIMAAPGLERYKIRQAVLAALTLPRIADETEEAYLKRIDEDGKAHAKRRAEEGTAIHKAIEQFLRGETYDTRWHPQVSAVVAYLHTLGNDWVADFKSKSTLEGFKDYELFYDNHVMQLAAYKRGLVAKLLEGAKDGPDFQCETTFASHWGYGGRVDAHSRMVTGGALVVSILVSVDEPGTIRTKVWTREEEERGLDMFSHCLSLWQIKNRILTAW